MMSTAPKIVWSSLIDIINFILIIYFMSLNLGSVDATEWWILPNDEKEETDFPIEKTSDKM